VNSVRIVASVIIRNSDTTMLDIDSSVRLLLRRTFFRISLANFIIAPCSLVRDAHGLIKALEVAILAIRTLRLKVRTDPATDIKLGVVIGRADQLGPMRLRFDPGEMLEIRGDHMPSQDGM
jgi:hypothetical protein